MAKSKAAFLFIDNIFKDVVVWFEYNWNRQWEQVIQSAGNPYEEEPIKGSV